MGSIEPRPTTLTGGRAALIRTAHPDDAEAMIAHLEHMFTTNPFMVTERGEKDRTDDEQRSWIREHSDGPGNLALVTLASSPGLGPSVPDRPGSAAPSPVHLIGVLLFRNGNRRKLAHHGVFGISVHESWRGSGAGSAMIRALLDWAEASPIIEKVCLGCFATNERALALYRRLGFVEEGRQRRHFRLGPGTYVDDVQMCMYVKPGIAPPGFGTHPARVS